VKAVQDKRVKTSSAPFWIAAVGLTALDLFLIFWTPDARSYKSPIAVPVVSFFLAVIVFCIFSQRMERRLAQEMRAPAGTITDPETEFATPQPAVGPPAYTGAIHLLSAEDAVALSPAAKLLAERARRTFDECIGWHLVGIWLLIAASLGMALFGSASLPFAKTLVAAARWF